MRGACVAHAHQACLTGAYVACSSGMYVLLTRMASAHCLVVLEHMDETWDERRAVTVAESVDRAVVCAALACALTTILLRGEGPVTTGTVVGLATPALTPSLHSCHVGPAINASPTLNTLPGLFGEYFGLLSTLPCTWH